MNLRSKILQLQGGPAYDIRNGWHHYSCLVCDDRSHHMGVNWQTGRVRCLRCGLRLWLNVTVTRGGIALKREDPEEYQRMGVAYTRHGDTPSCLDHYVYEYAKSRGLKRAEEIGWALGRNELVGNFVFPVLNSKGKTVYLQYRNINTRWRSMVKGTVPRLDHWPILNNKVVPNILVLAEGPVDVLKIRQYTPLWASPTFGVDGVTRYMVRDIRQSGVKRVLVWFDAEKRAEVKANRLARNLRVRLDCEVVPVSWGSYSGTDQGDCTEKQILDTLGEYV